MEKIDVEKIMSEIRQEIKDKGYTKEEISYAQILANMDSASLDKCYNRRALRTKYDYISNHYNNPIYFELKGNPIKVMIQRLIRRTFLFVIFPAFHYQNVFNEGVADCIRQLKNYIDENDEVKYTPKKMAKLENLLKLQQEQIQVLQKELEILKSRIQ